MKILYLTGMYPTKEAPHGGVFITKRIEAVKKTKHEYLLYAVAINDSTFVKKVRGFFNRNQKNLQSEIKKDIKVPNSEIEYHIINVELGFIDKFLNKITGYHHQVKKTYKAMVKQLGNVDCDIIHGHWLYPTGAAVQKYADYLKKPVVITSHGSDVNVLMENTQMKKHILNTLERVDLVEFVSNALLSNAKSFGYSGDNATVVPNGIDKVHSKISNKSNRVIIGFVGNLNNIKRVDKLPDIIKNILKYSNKDLEFHIIGDGILKETVEKQLDYENVKFFGRVSHGEVLKRMQEMSVLMLPSRNEGWPCVVLESHSCGVPVVGSSNGGIPEAINDSRLIIEEENFEHTFAQRVLEVINSKIVIDKEVLIERSKNYIWDSLVLKTIENYKSLIR